jgi:hypothetical protein
LRVERMEIEAESSREGRAKCHSRIPRCMPSAFWCC